MAEDGSKRRNLGRGLSALLGSIDNDPPTPQGEGSGTRVLAVSSLTPGRYQPRSHFDDDSLQDLVESVREKGVIQPLLVRPLDDGRYEIIAGERRWRAAQIARVHEVPVLVRDLTDREALELSLVENLQRQDLTPLEEAEGYRRLMDEFGHTQEDLGRALGKSRSHVANMLRLLSLPDPVKDMVNRGQLTMGHARALLTTEDPVAMANEVVTKGLSVRQTEALVQAAAKGKPGAKNRHEKDADTLALENDLSASLGLRVTIRSHAKGGGELTIHYESLEQLDDVLNRLGAGGAGKEDPVADSDPELTADMDAIFSDKLSAAE